MTWLERQTGRLRSLDSMAFDSVLAVLALVACAITVWTTAITPGFEDVTAVALITCAAVTLPLAVRRRWPLEALAVSCAGIVVHILVMNWPEGALPIPLFALTYSVAARDTPRRAVAGLAVVYATLAALWLGGAPGLDALSVAGNLAVFTVGWVVGVALRARRETLEARLREAEERAEVARQSSARMLAEERLRIAQELHDVVAHSMSVIAVQAGVGAHVLDDRPDAARAALEAISATSRGTLVEMRRLLGALRDEEGERSHAPAPALDDLAALIDDVRGAGIPVELTVTGAPGAVGAAIELSAFRVVQEALTNVIKHAGPTTRVQVTVAHAPGALTVEVVDDGRGAASVPPADETSSGHGLRGMRERVELWGGDLAAGPVTGGGYRVRALLPVGDER